MTSHRSTVPRFAHLRDKRWTAEDADEVLTAWARSGESMAGFARENGLQAHRLQYWSKRLSKSGDGSEYVEADVGGLSFAPVIVKGVGTAPAAVVRVGAVEVEVHDPKRVSGAWIAELAREVERG
jgi:transposase-like protein